jgi:hypothetical protein
VKQVGRNDPCPCGSGKKYKHCCLRADRARRAARRASRGHTQPRGESAQFSGPAQLRDAIQQAKSVLPDGPDQELAQLLELAEEVSAYEAMQDEIEAASLALEEYRAEFIAAMQDDPQAMAERSHALFSEERFARWRWNAADVHRAFEAVGYPSWFETGEMERAESMVAAILHLADHDLRMRLARHLTMLLPEYVAQQRPLDAWLIQFSGFQMIEAPDSSNPFFFEMFQFGYGEWADQIADQRTAAMRLFGLDPAKVIDGEMDTTGFEDWVQERIADPDTRARLEAYLDEHPMLHEKAQAEALELGNRSFLLLEREDASPLFLSPEEVEPWLEPLWDRLRPLEALAVQAVGEGRVDDPQLHQEMRQLLVEISREMATSVFTPERMEQLAETLRAYRKKLQDAGEKQAALYAQGGLLELEHEPNPADNRLLIGICLVSLRAAFREASEQAAEDTPEG